MIDKDLLWAKHPKFMKRILEMEARDNEFIKAHGDIGTIKEKCEDCESCDEPCGKSE